MSLGATPISVASGASLALNGPQLFWGPPAAVSVLLRGKRRLSGVDVERMRLLHHYPLHQCRPDVERLTDLQYAPAALVEAQDAALQ
jgi:hypothetical protein